MKQIFIFLFFCSCISAYSQDKKGYFDQFILERRLDTLNSKLYSNPPTIEMIIKEELKNFGRYKLVADSLMREGIYNGDDDIILNSNMLKKYTENEMKNLRHYYPISMASVVNDRNFNRLKTNIKIAGISQAILGGFGVLFTIIDANSKESFSINNEKVSYHNNWGKLHTATTILGGSLILSGIFIIFI